ncbi:hypothetical protein RHGRI_032439 [Rhododendron griersonianum]|uniref:HMA domain-containing protein n=1 Tax=Rhododendron griersonianum TaxID=479676 RepID=A0AAV6IGN8_9ERIC|nr:hypothetical protein RHGRI_032439 [Rhododendron griersonianum]
MAEKVTTMVLKVDLQCPSCYRKIKKVLAKFPQIRNQTYDEKQNTVTITVVCCSPEKIRDKLCCKGGKTIKSIEIKPPPKPKEPEKPPKAPEKQKGPEIPTVSDKPKEPDKTKEPEKSKPTPPAPLVYVPVPVCYGQCYEGIPGGPCYEGYGRPVPSYDGYGYGGNRACYGVSHCDEYFNEENTSGCTIM